MVSATITFTAPDTGDYQYVVSVMGATKASIMKGALEYAERKGLTLISVEYV